MDVTAGRDADCPGPFFADKGVTLLSVEGVVKPPDVVRFSSNGDDAAERDRIRNGAASRATNIPDRDSLIPERRDENSISYVDVVHERTSHHGGEDLRGRRRIGQIHYHKPSGISA